MQPERITITSLSGDQSSPAVASMPTEPDKGQYLVAWTDNTPSTAKGEIWAQRIGGEGNTEGGLIRITDDPDDETMVYVAAGEQDHQYLVITARQLDALPGKPVVLLGRKVSLEGDLLGREAWLEEASWEYAVASGPGSDFLIAFAALAPPPTTWVTFGHLWGDYRVYLPLVVR
jgi:hypothetical protein